MCVRAIFLTMLLWLAAVPVQAQEITPADRPTKNVCTVGVYLSDLYDIHPQADRFGADVWAWSVCSASNPLQFGTRREIALGHQISC